MQAQLVMYRAQRRQTASIGSNAFLKCVANFALSLSVPVFSSVMGVIPYAS